MRSSGLILFVCAGLMLSGGAILGGSAAWSLLRMSYYFWTSDLGVELGASVLFMAGALLCLPSCWLASIVPYHTKSISLLGALIALVTASMLILSLGVTSLSGLSRTVREPAALNASMLHAMAHVGFDPAVRSSFSAMQIERSDQCTIPLYTTGCLRPALLELRNYSNAISVLASAIILVLAVTLFAGAYTLVSTVLEQGEPRGKPQPMRIACLPHTALPPLVALSTPAPAHV